MKYQFVITLMISIYLFNNGKTFDEFEQNYFKNMFCFVILCYMNLLNVPLITHNSN